MEDWAGVMFAFPLLCFVGFVALRWRDYFSVFSDFAVCKELL